MIETTVNLQEVPLTALRERTLDQLSFYLDALKILPSPDGLSRDWRGLLHLSGLSQYHSSFMSTNLNPTRVLIKVLANKTEETLATFRKMLGDIDRWDVVDDTSEMFVEDAIVFLKNKEKSIRTTSQSTDSVARRNQDINRITRDDVFSLQQYDAFILFADNDIDFATEMIEKLENSGFKLCVKERDFLAGVSFEHDAIRHLLTERCGRLIVILSPDFVNSPLNEFISNLAQSLGIAQRKRKIIPCLYKSCDELPEIFQHIHLLNYQRSQKFFNFWDKLRDSLRSTPEELTAIQSGSQLITDSHVEQPMLIASISKSSQQIPAILVDNEPLSPAIIPRKRSNKKFLKPQSVPLTPTLVKSDSKKIWPPQPKLRSATSMVNLTDLDLTETNNNENSCTMVRRTKKLKWYSKLSNTLKFSGSDLNLNQEKEKSKKTLWRRIKSTAQ